MILLDLLIILCSLIIGLRLKGRFKSFNYAEKKFLNKLFFYHVAFSVIFNFYIQFSGGDATFYWMGPKYYSLSEVWSMFVTIGRPTETMLLLNYFPSNFLGLSFLTGNIIYGVIGYSAFVYFLQLLKHLMPHYYYLKKVKVMNVSVFPMMLFLPNLHFWSAGVGKDTLLFFSVSLFAYSLINIKKMWVGLLLSLLVSYYIRPHITLFLLSGFGLGYVFSSNIKSYKRFFLAGLAVVTFSFLFSKVLDFVKIDEFNTENVEQFSDAKVKALAAHGGSTVDITDYPYPFKIMTFLYRPFFYDINNPIAVVASFENLLLLLLTLRFLKGNPLSAIRKSHYLIRGAFFFFLIGTCAFSLILGNLGIMLRQKNMFMLMFFLFILWSYYHNMIIPYLKNKNGN